MRAAMWMRVETSSKVETIVGEGRMDYANRVNQNKKRASRLANACYGPKPSTLSRILKPLGAS